MKETGIIMSGNHPKLNTSVPLLVIITYVTTAVVYHFFTPWYIRLWHRVRRQLQRVYEKGKGR